MLALDSNNNAVAPGVLPRLPLPVPEAEGEQFRDFVRRRRGPRGKDHLFVDLTEQELAPFGTAAPICGVVLLQHGPATRSELMPATEAEVLKEMIPRSTARNASAVDRLDRLRAIIHATPCFNLRYTTGEETVRLLQDEFGPAADEPAANFGPPWKDDPSLGTEKLYRRSHALIIGIAEYTGGWRWLRNPVRDAERVADELRHRGFGVTLRKNITGKALHRELHRFFTQEGADPEARLFLWFEGHGHNVDDDGFLVPADAPPPMFESFAAIALPMRELGDLVRLAEAKHVLCVVNSCTACTIFDPRTGPPSSVITDDTKRPVRQFITAGELNSYVSDDGRFCRMFLRALRGEDGVDADGDGYVTGSELGAFLADCLPKLTDGAQTPRFGKLADDAYNRGDFVFSLPHEGTVRV